MQRRARTLVVAGLAALAAPLPAAAQTDPIAQAVAADRGGDPDRAIQLLEPLVAAHDRDTDALRVLGVAYLHAGRKQDAIATLRRARALAPRDQDIAAALARALASSGQRSEAATTIDAIATADPSNAELPALRDLLRTPSDARSVLGLNAAFGIARVSTAAGDRTWRDYALSVDAHLDRNTVITGDVQHSDRAGLRDDRFSIGAAASLSPHVRISGAVSATPQADFRERWGVQAGVEGDVTRFVTLLFDVRHLDFAKASTTILQPGVRLHPASQRAALSLRSIVLFDERGGTRAGVSARGDLDLGHDRRLFAGAAAYPDTEAGVTRRMRSIYAGAAIPLTSALTARLTVDHDDRRDSYKRTGVTLGLGWRIGP